MALLAIFFFSTAILYSSVGFGGGSTYLALLLILNIPYFIFPIISVYFGYIFFDDTESLNYRKSRNFTISVNNDAIDNFVKEFYDNNSFQLLYIKYFKGSGLSEFTKLSDLGSLPVLSKRVWKYNSTLGYIYLFIKKILYLLKSKDKS